MLTNKEHCLVAIEVRVAASDRAAVPPQQDTSSSGSLHPFLDSTRRKPAVLHDLLGTAVCQRAYANEQSACASHADPPRAVSGSSITQVLAHRGRSSQESLP